MKKVLSLMVSFLLIANISFGAPNNSVSTPNSYSANTVIQSADMNANFAEHQSKYNTHSHTDITQVGTITTGGWNGSVIATQYGGTGQDWSGASTGSIVQFNGSTTSIIPAPTTAGYVLSTKSGSTAPEWASASSGAKDAITRGFEVVIEQPNALRCVINAGTLYHDTTSVDKTTGTILTFATASNWASGSTVSFAGGAGFNYIGSSATGQIALLGNLPPNRTTSSDTNPHTPGTKYYSYDGTTYWRMLGAVRINTSNQVQDKYFQRKNSIIFDDVSSNTNVRVLNAGNSASFTNVDCSSVVPAMGDMVDLFCPNADSTTLFVRTGSSATNGHEIVNGVNDKRSFYNLPLTNTQTFQYKITAGASATIFIQGYEMNIR